MKSDGSSPWRQEFPWRPHFVTIDAQQVHYVDEGDGEVLLLVHGNPTWSFYWRQWLPELRRQYRVIAPDHVGSGLSDKPQRYPYRLRQHSQNLTRLLDHLGIERCTLIGHDWGGAIGLHCGLIQSPGRFDRVVLLNTGAFPPPRIPRRIDVCRLPGIGTWLVRGLNVFPRSALRMAVSRPRRFTDAERAGILAPYPDWKSRVGISGFIRDIPAGRRHPTWADLAELEAALKQLRGIPVALVWGMRDWCFDARCLQRMNDLIPHATLVRLEEAGHWVVEDRPHESLQAVQQFLLQHPIADESVPTSVDS